MAASSSSSTGSWRYDVFPSFSGVDVRRGFLSYLLKEFNRKAINSFIDNGIERSHQIADELLLAINQARIAIVIFSKNYASSTWCLKELAEIHKCYKELNQMVIPVFYYVDPSHVRKQEGEFGEFFMKTCEGKTDDEIQRWKQALKDVADLAGEHLGNGPNEADMVEKIANDVSNKLLSPSNGFGDFVGIEAHIKAMDPLLCMESEEPRMIGIWGQSGIGKSTLGRALFTHLSEVGHPKFHFRNFTTYKCTDEDHEVYGMKLNWEQKFLSEILNQKDLKIEKNGVVKERFKDKKVLIVLDDVFKPSFLETLVGKTEWFGPGSRIIVITQDKHLLEAHKIDVLYEVKIPAPVIALKMLCRYAFAQDFPPDDFKKLAVKVAKVAGDLPLGLSVLGSSLKGRTKEEWMEVLPELQNGLEEDIMKVLRVSYNRLKEKDRCLFLWIASFFNGQSVKFINEFFGDGNFGLKRLAEKSLIRITKCEYKIDKEVVGMHNLLQKLGKEIDREESKGNPGQRRFLTDTKEVEDVFTHQKGTETVLVTTFIVPALKSYISLDEKSFQGMSNLQALDIYNPYDNKFHHGVIYLPPKLKLLGWRYYPLKCLPSNFKAEYLVHLVMEDSKLEKLWEGTQQLGSLKTLIMRYSYYLKEIPDLSKAINLKKVNFSNCYNLESFPNPLNWESLEYLNLLGCNSLKNFPQIIMQPVPHGTEIYVFGCLWNKNLAGLDYLDCLRRCYPLKFLPEHIVELNFRGFTMEKLWEGVQSLGSLRIMNLSHSHNLKEIPDLSKAINLKRVDFSNCYSLKSFPSPLNWESLEYLNLIGCCSLKNFPQILMETLPNGIEITVYDCLWNKNLPGLDYLDCLKRCYPLKFIPEHIVQLNIKGFTMEKLWEGVQSLGSLREMKLSESENLKEIPDLSKATNLKYLNLWWCKSLVRFPSTIGNPQKLEELDMWCCTGLKDFPVNVNLSSLRSLMLRGCSSLKSFPQISHCIEELYLDDTAIEEIPCCIEMFRKLTKLYMRCCSKLKNISPKIFRLTNLKQVDFTDCGGVITMLSDATIKDPYETIEKGNKVDKDKDEDWYFNFGNCLKLDRDARELIIQSSLKWTVILPGGEVPTYFNHRAFGSSLTVTLPQSSICHQFLRFNVCVAVDPITDFSSRLYLQFRFDGLFYKQAVCVGWSGRLKNHLVLFSFKFKRTGIPSKLDSNEVEFKFHETWGQQVIKEVGIRLLNVSPSVGDRDRISSETDCNQQFGEKGDVVETERSNERTRMPSSEEYFNLPCDQIVESSSVSSYPCLEGEALCIDSMISLQQDAQLLIVDPSPDPYIIQQSSSSANAEEDFNITSDQIVTDTTMPSPNLELRLGQRGESPSVSSYPCQEGEALCIDSMITEQQDDQIPEPDLTWQPTCSSTISGRASKFCSWKGLLKRKKKKRKNKSVEVSN